MISLRELLQDPIYKAYFSKIPKLPRSALQCSTPPWRVLFKTNGRWKSVNADTYKNAYLILKRSGFEDGAISCRRVQFQPPIRNVRIKNKFYIDNDGNKKQVVRSVTWRPKLPEAEQSHNWCPYCRRPTVFAYYRKHHALSLNVELDPSVLRCGICGASERIVTLK